MCGVSGVELSEAKCLDLYHEHCHYWHSTVQVLQDRTSELLEIAQYAHSVYGVSHSVHLSRLRDLKDKLKEECDSLDGSVSLARDGGQVFIHSSVRRRVHDLSEQVHHLDAAMRQAGPPIDDLPAGQVWPSGAAGSQGVNGALELFVRDMLHLLPERDENGDQKPLIPIARWRWIARYNFYPHSGTACYPVGDLQRMRTWPLLVHEFGHRRYNARRDLESSDDPISANWFPVTLQLTKLYQNIAGKLGQEQYPFHVNSLPSLRSHFAEYLCDVVAAKIMGAAYLHAFCTFAGSDGDSPALEDPKSKGKYVIEWLCHRTHPPVIIRYHVIARVIRRAGGIDEHSEVNFLDAMLSGDTIRAHHRAAAEAVRERGDELIELLLGIVNTNYPDCSLTCDHYARAEALLQSHGRDMHTLTPTPDARTIVLAATLKRIYQGGPSGFAGSYMTSIMRLLKSQGNTACHEASS